MSARRLHLAARAEGRIDALKFTRKDADRWSRHTAGLKRWLRNGGREYGIRPHHVDTFRKIASTLRNS